MYRKFCFLFVCVANLNATAALAAPTMGPRLEHLAKEYSRAGHAHAMQVARDNQMTIRDTKEGRITVIIEPETGIRPDQIKLNDQLRRAGIRRETESKSFVRISVPVRNLRRLSTLAGAKHIRAPYPLFEAGGLGNILNESVDLIGGEDFHKLSVDGNGVKVAVVDLGFSQLSAAITDGEIPGSVVQVDFTGGGTQAGTKHGTGVSELLIDMAPNAQLYCIRIGDEVDLQNAATYINDNGIKVANLSVAWVGASYYDDTGPINQIINDSYDLDGIFWSVAAGNYARRHWRGGWVDADGDDILDFSPTDERIDLSGTSGTIIAYMNWNEYGASNKADLNLYLLDKDGNVVQSSTYTQSRFNDPLEGFSYTYDAAEAPYSLEIRRASGDISAIDITLFSLNHNVEYRVPESSIADPASAHGAFTVGAINQSVWQDDNPSLRGYSSQGPTTDGRLKPDAVAPDGTSTRTYGLTNSNGTSFSAPTVGGAAALLFDNNPAYSALDVGNNIRATAIPSQ